MTTLITGGASQTGLALARRLVASSHPVLFGVRTKPIPASLGPSVKFDWNDPSTFSNPFDASNDIKSVYLLPPVADVDPLLRMQPFIDLAVEKGVKKFVLLSSTIAFKGPDAHEAGRVHNYLESIGVDYVALQPTWYIGKNLLVPYHPLSYSLRFPCRELPELLLVFHQLHQFLSNSCTEWEDPVCFYRRHWSSCVHCDCKSRLSWYKRAHPHWT